MEAALQAKVLQLIEEKVFPEDRRDEKHRHRRPHRRGDEPGPEKGGRKQLFSQ